MLPIQTQTVLGAPGWVLRDSGGKAATIDFDFEHGRLYQRGLGSHSNYGGLPGSRFITTSRASAGYIDNLAGLYTSVAANIARVSDKGLLVEEARTNLALWCRDLTNAVWVPTTMTAALTATGIDGAANSATTITATGALAKILQTVTHTSSADTVSFFIKRRTGTGTIEITGDGVAFTDITASLSTTAWYRATVTATLVNPVFGIRITTSGDAVDVDFAQLEVGSFVTSPILTTTVAITRAADAMTSSNILIVGSQYSIYAIFIPVSQINNSSNQVIAQIDDASNNNRLAIFRQATTGNALFNTTTNAVGTNVTSVSLARDAKAKLVFATFPNAQRASANGNSVVSSTSALPISPTTLRIGASFAGNFANAYIQRLTIWLTERLSNSFLQRIST